jgi:hypothetical protein
MPITVTGALSRASARPGEVAVNFAQLARRTQLDRTRAEGLVFVAASSAIARATLLAVAWVAGFGEVGERLLAVRPDWFAVAFAAEIVAYVG